MSDVATALTGSVPTDGSASMTGALRLVDGAVGTPGLTWATETTSGWYRIGAGDFGFSIASNKILEITANGLLALSLSVTAANVPGNGLYLPSASTLGFSTANTARGSINSVGNWNILAPTAGNSLTATAFSTNIAIRGTATTAGSNSFAASPGSLTGVAYSFDTNGTVGIYQSAANNIDFGILGTNAGNINSSRNWTISAPSSGATLTLTGPSGNRALTIQGNTTAGNSLGFNMNAGTNATDQSFVISNAGATQQYMLLDGAGSLLLGGATGGVQGLGTLNSLGIYILGNQLFFGSPASASTTAAVTDVGKTINAAGNIAINNAIFSQGHWVQIYNNTAASITINGTITTMRLAASATTGNRTLAARGLAYIWFEGSTECIVSGAGVS